MEEIIKYKNFINLIKRAVKARDIDINEEDLTITFNQEKKYSCKNCKCIDYKLTGNESTTHEVRT